MEEKGVMIKSDVWARNRNGVSCWLFREAFPVCPILAQIMQL